LNKLSIALRALGFGAGAEGAAAGPVGERLSVAIDNQGNRNSRRERQRVGATLDEIGEMTHRSLYRGVGA
jgi:hypothetical protein